VLKDIGIVDELKRTSFEGFDPFVFAEVEPNPSCDTVDRGAYFAKRENVEVVVGLGGGSSMDSAKAIACLKDTDGKIIEYLNGEKLFLSRSCQLIAIPTTSGTGSEVTNVGVYSDKSIHVKKSMVSSFFWNDIAYVDPELTYSVPKRTTASTGLDAFVHALESYWAVTSNPVSDSMAMRSIKLIIDNLYNAFSEPENKCSRKNMSLASLLAGMAFSQTRTTILHAMSYPFTNDFGLDHGFACSLLLIPILEEFYPHSREKLDALVNFLGLKDFEELKRQIFELMNSIDAPMGLNKIGAVKGNITDIALKTNASPLSRLGPKTFSNEELEEFLMKQL